MRLRKKERKRKEGKGIERKQKEREEGKGGEGKTHKY